MNKELLNLLPGSWYAPKAAPCCHRPLLLAIMHLYDKILNSSIVSVYNYFLDIYILGVDQSDRMVLSVFVFFIVACLSVFALSVCLLSVFVFLIVALWRCCLSLYSLSSSIFLLLYGVIFCIRTVCPDFLIFFLLCGVVVCLCTVCLHRFSCYSMVWCSFSVPSAFIPFLPALWRCGLSLYCLFSSFFLLLFGVIFCLRTICLNLFFFLLSGVVVCLWTLCLDPFSWKAPGSA